VGNSILTERISALKDGGHVKKEVEKGKNKGTILKNGGISGKPKRKKRRITPSETKEKGEDGRWGSEKCKKPRFFDLGGVI